MVKRECYLPPQGSSIRVMSAASGTPLVAKKPHPSAALPDAFSLPSLPCWVVPLCEPVAGSPPLRSFRHSVPGHSPSARSRSLHSKVKPAPPSRTLCHPRLAIPPASARSLYAAVPPHRHICSAPHSGSFRAAGVAALHSAPKVAPFRTAGAESVPPFHSGPHTAPVSSAFTLESSALCAQAMPVRERPSSHA